MSGVPPWLAAMVRLDEGQLRRLIRNAPGPVRRRLSEEWSWQAHGGQGEPPACAGSGPGDWRVWLMLGGRGFGKTRAGAEWVLARARENKRARIALVGPTLDDVAKVMVEGESGLIACARSGEAVRWCPSKGIVVFPSGALGFAFSGERPGKLRGPQHHYAWCDEIAEWRYGNSAWDNMILGLRLGAKPCVVATTTPKPVRLLKRLIAGPRTVVTGGPMAANVHLSPDFAGAVTALYAGTRLGRQELDGLLIEEAEGALWSRALLEASRAPLDFARDERSSYARVVIGVDPPGSVHGDSCGIVAAGLGHDGTGYVIGDHSVTGRTPEGWAAAVAEATAYWGADRVIAEANQGGNMVESVLRAAMRDLPLRLAHAKEAKWARAEPVSTLFARGRAKLAWHFPELEDELTGIVAGGGYEGPGRSPDRADAMVWALAELMLGEAGTPRIRRL